MWDADDGDQSEFFEKDKVGDHVKDDTQKQFGEWRNAVEKIVSFAEATGLEGALVQLALTLDTLSDILPMLRPDDQLMHEGREMQINRLVHSALRAVRRALPSEIDPAVGSIVKSTAAIMIRTRSGSTGSTSGPRRVPKPANKTKLRASK